MAGQLDPDELWAVYTALAASVSFNSFDAGDSAFVLTLEDEAYELLHAVVGLPGEER